MITKTTELGNGWLATQRADGSMIIHRAERLRRIDLPASSVQTLRTILVQAGTIGAELLRIAKEHEQTALYYARKAEATGDNGGGFRLTAKLTRDVIDRIEGTDKGTADHE